MTVILGASTEKVVATTSLIQLGESVAASLRAIASDFPTIDPGFLATLRGDAIRTLTYLPVVEQEPVAEALTTLELFEVEVPAEEVDAQPAIDWTRIAAVCAIIQLVYTVVGREAVTETLSYEAGAIVRYFTALLVALLGHPPPCM